MGTRTATESATARRKGGRRSSRKTRGNTSRSWFRTRGATRALRFKMAGKDEGNVEEDGEMMVAVGNVREQDRYLPIANISRIMKKSLPNNAKIAKDVKETVQECVSEFISFITSEASDKCQREKRKTINGEDLLWAMTTLGFEDYVEPLKVYLHKFREAEGQKDAASKQVDAGDGTNT